MSSLVYFAPLGSADARRIHRLQHRLFPRHLRESLQEIEDILRNTEEHLVCNLSFGVFDDTRLVGYLFGYVEDESLFHEREEEVIYLKEIALLPGYERFLLSMFAKLYEQWSAFTPQLPLEAHAEAEALETWRRMARLFKRLGLTLSTRDEASTPGRPSYKLLRLDVSTKTGELAGRSMPLPAERWQYRDDIGVTLVTDPRQWLALREVWDTLLDETEDGNVFQSFDYLWEWWRHFGFWNELRIIVIRRGESVIGIAPLMLEYFTVLGRVARKLMFMTAPMEMSRPKLLFGHNQQTCLAAVLAFLEHTRADWDILDIDEQLLGRTTDSIVRHFQDTRCLIAESETICPYTDLRGTWKEFMSGLSRRMRSNINRLRRKLAERGEVRVRCVKRWPELDDAMEAYCRIEEKSWKAARNLHLTGEKSHYFFHKGLARVFGENGEFELRILECNGEPLAATYGIARNGVFQSLKIAHKASHDALSPGTLLESYELEDMFGSGLRSYEFMGSFLSNKLRWTDTAHRTVNVHVYQRQWRLVLFYFIYFVFKRQVKIVLKRTGQFDRVDRLLNRLGKNPFPRY